MNDLKKAIQLWQDEVFPERTLASELLKLEEEIREYEETYDSEQIFELADIQIILWGLEKFNSCIGNDLQDVWQETFDYYRSSLVIAIADKLAINKARKWEFKNGVYKHID